MGTIAVKNCFTKEKACEHFTQCKATGTIAVKNCFMKEKVREHFPQCKAMGTVAVKKIICVKEKNIASVLKRYSLQKSC